jgi:hypothetical protein
VGDDRAPGGRDARGGGLGANRAVALDAGIEVLELDGTFELDLALDGADEVDRTSA